MICVPQFDAAGKASRCSIVSSASGGCPIWPRCAWTPARARNAAVDFAAGAFHTLYSGSELGDHGVFYPFQWSAGEQRARYATAFDGPPAVWERLAAAGLRTLAIDPGRMPSAGDRERRLHLRLGVRRSGRAAALVASRGRRAGARPAPRPRPGGDRGLRPPAPARAPAPAREPDRRAGPDRRPRRGGRWRASASMRPGSPSAPPTSPATSSGTSPRSTRGRSTRSRAGRSRARSTRSTSRSIVPSAACSSALPAGAEVIVTSAVGMDVNTSRADLLPEMLAAVLAGGPVQMDGSGAIWRLRARMPTGLRRAIAGAIPIGARADRAARAAGARLDHHPRLRPSRRQPGVCAPFNLRGRERQGIVDPDRGGWTAGRGRRRALQLRGSRRAPGGLDRASPRALPRPARRAPTRPRGALVRASGDEADRGALGALRHRSPPRRRLGRWPATEYRRRRVGDRRSRALGPCRARARAASRGRRCHRLRACRRGSVRAAGRAAADEPGLSPRRASSAAEWRSRRAGDSMLEPPRDHLGTVRRIAIGTTRPSTAHDRPAHNDDGIGAAGLHALRRALLRLDGVEVRGRSAHQPQRHGGSITTRSPIWVEEIEFDDGSTGFATEGTPVDCVRFADLGLLGERPDLIVSGINHGSNLGDDITYSGMPSRRRSRASSSACPRSPSRSRPGSGHGLARGASSISPYRRASRAKSSAS